MLSRCIVVVSVTGFGIGLAPETMDDKGFRVIARAPGRDAEIYERVGAALGRTFKLDATEVATSLADDGVVVCEVPTFEEARVYANRVREMGADSLVLNPAGKVVEQTGSPRARNSEPALDQTMLGGFQAPAQAPPAIAARPEEDLISLDDTAPSFSAPAPAPTAAPAPAADTGGGFSLDQLDENSLVLLDGSTEEHTPPPREAAPAGDGAAGMMEFAPPAEDEVLELDDSASSHSHSLGVGASSEKLPEAEPPGYEPPEEEQQEEEGEVEWVPADDGEAGPSLAPERPLPPRPTAPVALREQARGWRGAVQRSRSPLELPRELARVFPRLRIIIGFVLAMGLGTIAPTCYSSSVLDSRVQPLLVDLSTARAHGQLLMGLPSYRSPEQLEEQISSIKTRHGIYAFLMWLAISGGLGFVWFHFVRE